MKKDLTGESIHLVNDETPEEDRIPEDMIEDVPEPEEIHGVDKIHAKRLEVGGVMGFMDHGGLMYDSNHTVRFPSSRDWNMPTIECKRKTCAACYNGKCMMPSLIKIGANGKCEGCHDRKSGKKGK